MSPCRLVADRPSTVTSPPVIAAAAQEVARGRGVGLDRVVAGRDSAFVATARISRSRSSASTSTPNASITRERHRTYGCETSVPVDCQLDRVTAAYGAAINRPLRNWLEISPRIVAVPPGGRWRGRPPAGSRSSLSLTTSSAELPQRRRAGRRSAARACAATPSSRNVAVAERGQRREKPHRRAAVGDRTARPRARESRRRSRRRAASAAVVATSTAMPSWPRAVDHHARVFAVERAGERRVAVGQRRAHQRPVGDALRARRPDVAPNRARDRLISNGSIMRVLRPLAVRLRYNGVNNLPCYRLA